MLRIALHVLSLCMTTFKEAEGKTPVETNLVVVDGMDGDVCVGVNRKQCLHVIVNDGYWKGEAVITEVVTHLKILILGS